MNEDDFGYVPHYPSAEETVRLAELDVRLAPLIAANPGLRPNDIASLVLTRDDPTGAAPAALAYAARRHIRDRVADLAGVAREPACMDAEEARLEAVCQFAVAREIAILSAEGKEDDDDEDA